MYARDQNYIFFIWGQAGSGKSECALSLGEMLSPNFNIDYVVFSVLDFFNLITSDKVKQGDFILFDEIGNAAGNRDYYEVKNKWLNKIMQCIRTKNLIVAYTAPKYEMADKQILGMCMGLVSTLGIDFQTNEGLVRIYDPVSYNMKTGEFGYKRLLELIRPSLINPKRLWHLKIGTTRVHRSSPKLYIEYKKRRDEYANSLAIEGRDELTQKAIDDKNSNKPRSINATQISEWAEEVVRNKQDYMGDSRFNLATVQNKFNCSMAIAKRVKEDVRMKLERIGFVVLWR